MDCMYISILKYQDMEFYMNPVDFITRKSDFKHHYIQNLLKLLDEGATIPFIARYRKELTGNMDEVQVETIFKLYGQFKELEKRKATILETIDQQNQLTPDLRKQIENCEEMCQLEDLYLPYKPKRQTRASKARDKGLEPLANWLMRQETGDVSVRGSRFFPKDMEVEEALQGARDIIAERLSEDKRVRENLRRQIDRGAMIVSSVIKGKEVEGEKYKDYFNYREQLRRCPSHRMLAIRRGEKEGFLRVALEIDDENAIKLIERFFVRASNDCASQVILAVKDAYKRLLFPSLESECLLGAKQKADEEAIKVFAENLRQLLLAPPLGNKRVLGIDPGFRTGCKVVCLDETGALLHNETIFPHPPRNEEKAAAAKINTLVNTYRVEAIAIGNGTAGRETERFIQRIRFERNVQVFVVSEDGASVYSASRVAREEFPEYDVTVRGAVSIARRLMDPLAELVKIDPKSIGVGQYQHDVDQTQLKESLDRVVESCVNRVGVNLNTASKYLLTYVSGLGPLLAENIVAYIRENGPFKSRSELKNVKRMGAKTFELCAGFLRIEGAENPLDNSAVHPESYAIVERMAKDAGLSVSEMIGNEALCNRVDITRYVDDRVGLPTLRDIMDELKKTRRDPRSVAKVFAFAENIHTIDDLAEGMVVPGIVTNLTNFGVFVDIGVKQDGLVHVSELADRFVSNPVDVVSLHQHVMVKVIQVDKARKRIALSMKQA